MFIIQTGSTNIQKMKGAEAGNKKMNKYRITSQGS